MLELAFFDGKNSCLCDVGDEVVFSPEALQDPEVGFVIVSMEARLLAALSDLSVAL